MTTSEILTSLKLQLLQALQKLAILAGMGNSVAVDTLLPWNMADVNGDVGNHHNVRALCDLYGLTVEQKNILAACVRVESNFNTQAIHRNYVYSNDGQKVLSTTDFGIVQINDFWHIGTQKDFPSSEYVLQNPGACVHYMVNYYKQNGHLNAWVSFTSKAYLAYLGKV